MKLYTDFPLLPHEYGTQAPLRAVELVSSDLETLRVWHPDLGPSRDMNSFPVQQRFVYTEEKRFGSAKVVTDFEIDEHLSELEGAPLVIDEVAQLEALLFGDHAPDASEEEWDDEEWDDEDDYRSNTEIIVDGVVRAVRIIAMAACFIGFLYATK